MDGDIVSDDLPIPPNPTPETPVEPPPPPATETRNILDSLSNIVGTLTLRATTTEPQWTLALGHYNGTVLPAIPGPLLKAITKTGTSNVTTSSGTASVISGMTEKPPKGTYSISFNGSISTSGASAVGEFGIYVDGSLLPETKRPISCNLQLLGGLVTVSLNAIGVGTYTGTEVALDGTQTVEVKFRSTNGGTIAFAERVLTFLKVKE